MSGIATFGDLFGRSWDIFLKNRSLIFAGVAVFGCIIGILQVIVLLTDSPSATSGMISTVLGLLSLVVSFMSYVYYLFIATDRKWHTGRLFQKSFTGCWSFIGLSVLVFLRSYTWILFAGVVIASFAEAIKNAPLDSVGFVLFVVGIVCAVAYLPRLMLSFPLWAIERKKPFALMRQSIHLAHGYWLKIFGNLVTLSLLFIAVVFLMGFIVGALSAIAFGGVTSAGNLILEVLIAFFAQCYQAFLSIFLVQLTHALMAHPRKS